MYKGGLTNGYYMEWKIRSMASRATNTCSVFYHSDNFKPYCVGIT